MRAALGLPLLAFIDRMHEIPGLSNTMTTLVLSSVEEVGTAMRVAAHNGSVARGGS